MFGLGKGNRLTLLESQIDNARGQRQWPVVFELVRKYAKSNPDSQLEWLIKAEYALDLAAQDTQEVKKLQELIIEHDRAQEFDPDQADVRWALHHDIMCCYHYLFYPSIYLGSS
eukprot:TRINITY_DN4611_c0_g1_i1.p2 TRINITY_DN4611_c0_g1~~TRINITY_DN4611_c0_g1_i1.p2  ORF type:complete len:114 (-),score=21.23 TRINITY_DN4611_c0_g1_i1:376-717(-)